MLGMNTYPFTIINDNININNVDIDNDYLGDSSEPSFIRRQYPNNYGCIDHR